MALVTLPDLGFLTTFAILGILDLDLVLANLVLAVGLVLGILDLVVRVLGLAFVDLVNLSVLQISNFRVRCFGKKQLR